MNSQHRLGRRQLTTFAASVPFGAALGLQAPGVPGVAAGPVLQTMPMPQGDQSLVYVNGHGSVRVPPDMATVEIGIEVERPTLTEAQAEAATLATAVIAAIEAAGVESDDIRTARFTVRVIRDRDRERERDRESELEDRENGREGESGSRETTGFQVSNAVEVTVRDIARLGPLLDDALAAGANEVRRIAFSLADPAAAAGQARALAMDDARTRADELAAAAGLAVSRVVAITELFAPGPMPVEFASANRAEMAIADASGGPTPIAIGTDEVVVEVQVTYELG